MPGQVNARLLAVSAHGAAVRRGHAADPHVQSGVVSMYAALGDVAAGGDVDAARVLFDGMPLRDHVAWNAMIAGYVHVGKSREALTLFDEMQRAGAAVDEATLVSVLTACAQIGASDRGKWVH